VNLVGTSGGQIKKFLIVFQKPREKEIKKLRKTGNFYVKSVLVFGITLKQMIVGT